MALFSQRSVDFDGSNDHVLIGDVAPLKFDVGDAFSISFWVRTTTSGTQRSIVSKRASGAAATGYDIAMASTGEVFIQIIDDVTVPQRVGVTTDDSLNDGFWHHVVITKDTTELASGITIYVDGAAAATTTFDDTFVSGGGTSFDNTTAFQISGYAGTNTIFLGNVDDVAVYDTELGAPDVFNIYNGGSPTDNTALSTAGNLVGYWLMGDGDTFPTLIDNSANTNNGTMTNMVSGDIEADFPTGIVPGSEIPGLGFFGSPDIGVVFSGAAMHLTGGQPGGAIFNFKMRALQDPGPGFETWVVTGSPDFAGTSAPGPIQAGTAIVADTWTS